METDCLVVGAGVIGLAIARAIAANGHDVVVIDAAHHIGTGISARSSQVIHAGIHHPGSPLKSMLCVEGMRQLYDFCDAHDVPYRRCGKLVVATSPDEISQLEVLFSAAAQRCPQLQDLSAAQLRSLEPSLRGVAAILSPDTGILDVDRYMHKLRLAAEAEGAFTALGVRLSAIARVTHGLRLSFAGEAGPALDARLVVNAAGLDAHIVAAMVPDPPAAFVPPIYYLKGSYFSFSGPPPFQRLIYPLPSSGGLGVHFTLAMTGEARFGPDAEWTETPDFSIDAQNVGKFRRAIQRYWPDVPEESLSPAYAAIRPRLDGPSASPADFMIVGPDDHGVAGIINLFGIESPGLTASLAIGAHVAQMAQQVLA